MDKNYIKKTKISYKTLKNCINAVQRILEPEKDRYRIFLSKEDGSIADLYSSEERKNFKNFDDISEKYHKLSTECKLSVRVERANVSAVITKGIDQIAAIIKGIDQIKEKIEEEISLNDPEFTKKEQEIKKSYKAINSMINIEKVRTEVEKIQKNVEQIIDQHIKTLKEVLNVKKVRQKAEEIQKDAKQKKDQYIKILKGVLNEIDKAKEDMKARENNITEIENELQEIYRKPAPKIIAVEIRNRVLRAYKEKWDGCSTKASAPSPSSKRVRSN